VLEFVRERSRKRRQGGDHKAAAATPPGLFAKLRRPFGH